MSWPARPLALGVVSERSAWIFVATNYFVAFATVWILSALHFELLAMLSVGVDAGLIFAYSVRPLRLKAIPFAGSLALASHGLALPLLTAWALAGPSLAFPAGLLAFVMLDGWATTTAEDFCDIAGDRVLGDWTAPTSYGASRAKKLAVVAYALAAALAIAFWTQDPSQVAWLTPLPMQAVLLVLALRLTEDPRQSRRIYALLIVFSFLAGAVVVLGLAQANA